MPMTEEERLAEFRARQERTQQAYDEQIAANAPPAGGEAYGGTDSSGDLGAQYAQGPGQGTGEGYKEFASSEEFAPMPDAVQEPVSLTSPYAFDQTSGGTPAPTVQPYSGQAYPGMPVIQEGGEFSYGYGQDRQTFGSEAEAMAARARDAQTNVQGQQLFRAQSEAAANAPPATEPTSIQLLAEMDSRQLSPAQRVELTQMQNGIARLQKDMREGRLPALQGQMLQAQLEQRMRPMMVSQSHVRGLQRVFEMQKAKEDAEYSQMLNARRNQFFAAHAPGSTIEHKDSQGNVIGHSTVGVDGRSTFTQHTPAERAPARPAAPPRPEINAASILQALRPHGSSSSGESSGGQGGLAAVPTDAQIDQQIELQGNIHNRLSQANDEHARLQPGGTLPFDPLPPGTRLDRLPWTQAGQQLINAAAQDADATGQRDRSRLIREIGGALRRPGATTGQLTPSQQQTLQGIGYYHDEFTPALDRELGRLENPPGVREGDGVTVTRRSTEPERDAARTIRNLLGRHGSVNSLPPNERLQFNGALAAIRVFNWGRSQEEQQGSRRGSNDPPARQAPPRRTEPNPLGDALARQSQYRS